MSSCQLFIYPKDEGGRHKVLRIEHGPCLMGTPRGRNELVVHEDELAQTIHELRTVPSPRSGLRPRPDGKEPYTDVGIVYL